MKDRVSDKPRGFGFVTYVDEAVADKVCEKKHELQGRQVWPRSLQQRLVAFSSCWQCYKPSLATTPTQHCDVQIDAKRSVPPQQQPRSKKVFVGGLAPATKEGKKWQMHFAGSIAWLDL